jgi:ATP-dependent protease Clp ATPase subunit
MSPQDRAQRCSFCGKRRHEAGGMASAGDARICAECLRLCHEITAERLN